VATYRLCPVIMSLVCSHSLNLALLCLVASEFRGAAGMLNLGNLNLYNEETYIGLPYLDDLIRSTMPKVGCWLYAVRLGRGLEWVMGPKFSLCEGSFDGLDWIGLG